MAEQSKPGQGVIIRADFGGGIDQSMDAWRVPPSQLSELVNGRLDKVGSVRKRTGYQPINPPKPVSGAASAGEPIAAMSAGVQTVVVDRARDNTLDLWAHQFPLTPQRIANECSYVARQYTPNTAPANNGWTTTGPVSDNIGDVIVLDGNAGDIDECVDYGADEGFLFVVKVTRARATNTPTTVTVSQYDANTYTLISEKTLSFSGGESLTQRARIYPKLIVYPNDTIVIAVAHSSGPFQAIVDFHLFNYSAAGLTFVTTTTPTTRQATVDYFDCTLYEGVPEERYRPVCPFDVCKVGTNGLFFAQFATGIGLRVEAFTVTASTITSVAATDHGLPIGVMQALTIAPLRAGATDVALVGVSIPFNSAVNPPYQTGNYQVTMITMQANGALRAWLPQTVTLAAAGSIAVPGRLTVGEYKGTPTVNPRICGLVETLEYATGFVYTHNLIRVAMEIDNADPPDVLLRKSYAIPVGRMFTLDYYGVVPSTNTVQARVPLLVGASQQTPLGRVALSNEPYTNFTGNYSGVIGTQILTGTDEMTLSACNGPLQTYAPRLQPCPPPSPVKSLGVWHIPHLVALDGGNGFGIALIRTERRTSGDAQPGAYATLPLFPAGVLQQADGERFAEMTLVDRPVIGAIIGSSAGTATDFLPGDYLVQAVASYRDAYGNIHRSTPSDPYRMVSVAAPLTSLSWQIWFGFQSYTSRNDVQIDFYVTEPNGTVLRYWFSAPNVLNNSFGVAVRRDSAIGGEGLPALDAPTLYTTGGVLPYIPLPAARFAVLYKNRLVVGGADDRRSLYYSNAPQAYQAASFAVGNVIRIEHETGCTAAGALGDKLIAFTDGSIWAVFGQFRDATGAGDAISEPEQIHDYIGCTQPASVVSTSAGLIFFGTDSRFYLIDDRLQIVPVGLRVQELTTGTGAMRLETVQAAVHIEAEREVRWYMQDTATGNVVVLIYNYQVDQWSYDRVTFTNLPFPGSWGAACWSKDFGTLVMTNFDWAKDDGTTWKDGTTWIQLSATTAWIQPGGSQDYSRFRYAQVLGRSISDHNLFVGVKVDFDDTLNVASGLWTAAQLAPIANTVYPEQVRLQVGTQKTQAVKITIADAAPSGATNGRGPQLVGLALEMLPLGGMRRLPDVRKK